MSTRAMRTSHVFSSDDLYNTWRTPFPLGCQRRALGGASREDERTGEEVVQTPGVTPIGVLGWDSLLTGLGQADSSLGSQRPTLYT